MKWFWFILFIINGSSIFAQREVTSENQDLVHIASSEIKKIFIPPNFSPLLKTAKISKAEFKVEFINFPEEAKPAFLYAVSIWENKLSSPVPVNIKARWEKMDNMVLAKSRPAAVYKSFEGAPVKNVYYPVALVEKLTGEETNSSVPDIICTFNEDMPWYFNTDGNTPELKYDFATVVLHEIAHGLGFFGFLNDNNGIGFISNADKIPSIYDYFIFNEMNQKIIDQSLFACPSEELHTQLTSGKLKFYNFISNNQGTDNTIDLYAPRVCNAGVSIYHVNQDNSDCSLMGPYTYRGEAIHNIDESTLKILSVIGWNSVNFDFQAPKDFGQPCVELPVDITVNGLLPGGTNQLQLVFSTDQFSTSGAVEMHFNTSVQKFEGKMPLNNFTGKLQYYFKLNTAENKSYFWPASAPDTTFSLYIGPDYYPPEIQHNPVKLIYPSAPCLNLSSIVEDKVGVKNVKVEYKLNGVLQDEFILSHDSLNHYSGQLPIAKQLLELGNLEYRIVANYESLGKLNMVSKPATGFYTVKVFEPLEPVYAYHSDFDEGQADFAMTDFSVSEQQGFTGNSLNTCHPYIESATKDEFYNHIAQLKYPIILNENGKMSFDEVVLIEPDEVGTKGCSPFFGDFAVVEGSNDSGKTWQPLTERYDAQLQKVWNEFYLKSISFDNTLNYIQQNMFVKHSISLTGNSNFTKGDTILVRFRLASDQSAAGWGWAIDNLDIQNETTNAINCLVRKDVNVYPNPCKNQVNIDLSAISGNSSVAIHVFDLTGKTVYLDSNFHSYRKSIDLSKVNPGIYFVTITEQNLNRVTKRIIKM